MGTTQREWERKHNFGKNTVSAAITGIRNNKKCQMILDTLSEEMRAEPGGWEQTISAMKEEADGMRKQLADFTRRLQYIEKRAIPWMNFCRTASSPSSLP
ncbi:hypothetical protein OPIT5_08265 [Opitutaceae bacterium TAV5]|nr:hypothetical protein OPIT5_08265 [Opitutaceae bacterium TAV5]